jgi:hypothetical protein
LNPQSSGDVTRVPLFFYHRARYHIPKYRKLKSRCLQEFVLYNKPYTWKEGRRFDFCLLLLCLAIENIKAYRYKVTQKTNIQKNIMNTSENNRSLDHLLGRLNVWYPMMIAKFGAD